MADVHDAAIFSQGEYLQGLFVFGLDDVDHLHLFRHN